MGTCDHLREEFRLYTNGHRCMITNKFNVHIAISNYIPLLEYNIEIDV